MPGTPRTANWRLFVLLADDHLGGFHTFVSLPQDQLRNCSALYTALNFFGCDAYKPDTRKNQHAADKLQRHDGFFE